MSGTDVEAEIALGQRFAFGINWQKFVRRVDDSRIEAADASLRSMLT